MATYAQRAYPCRYTYGDVQTGPFAESIANYMTMSSEPTGRFWQRMKFPDDPANAHVNRVHLRFHIYHRRLIPWQDAEARNDFEAEFASLVLCSVRLDPDAFPDARGGDFVRQPLRVTVSVSPAASPQSFTREGWEYFRIPNLPNGHPARNKRFRLGVIQQSHVQRPDGTWCWGADTSIRCASIEFDSVRLDEETTNATRQLQLTSSAADADPQLDDNDDEEEEEDSPRTISLAEAQLPPLPRTIEAYQLREDILLGARGVGEYEQDVETLSLADFLDRMLPAVTRLYTDGCVCADTDGCLFCARRLPAYTRLWRQFIPRVDERDPAWGTMVVPFYEAEGVSDAVLQRDNHLTARGSQWAQVLVDHGLALSLATGPPPEYPLASRLWLRQFPLYMFAWVLGFCPQFLRLQPAITRVLAIESTDFTVRPLEEQRASVGEYQNLEAELERDLDDLGCNVIHKIRMHAFVDEERVMTDILIRLDKVEFHDFSRHFATAHAYAALADIRGLIVTLMNRFEELASVVNPRETELQFEFRKIFKLLNDLGDRLEKELWAQVTTNIKTWMPDAALEFATLERSYAFDSYSKTFDGLFQYMSTKVSELASDDDDDYEKLDLGDNTRSYRCDIRAFERLHRLICDATGSWQYEEMLFKEIFDMRKQASADRDPFTWQPFNPVSGLDRLRRWCLYFDLFVVFGKIMKDHDKPRDESRSIERWEEEQEQEAIERLMHMYRTSSLDLCTVARKIGEVGVIHLQNRKNDVEQFRIRQTRGEEPHEPHEPHEPIPEDKALYDRFLQGLVPLEKELRVQTKAAELISQNFFTEIEKLTGLNSKWRTRLLCQYLKRGAFSNNFDPLMLTTSLFLCLLERDFSSFEVRFRKGGSQNTFKIWRFKYVSDASSTDGKFVRDRPRRPPAPSAGGTATANPDAGAVTGGEPSVAAGGGGDGGDGGDVTMTDA